MKDAPDERPAFVDAASPDVVQLVQITDCHVFAGADERLMGMNTRQSLACVCRAAAERNLDLVLATGDLSQDGSAASYQYLARQFTEIGTPIFWIPGNHDDLEVMAVHFRARRIHAARQLCVGNWLILLLDSTIPGQVHGRVSAAQLDFMHAALAGHTDRHAMLCLHHQAVDSGSEWLDRKGLRDSRQLRAEIAQHENVRLVLWGHVHQETRQQIDGIEWISTPSSCIQFKPRSPEFAVDARPPGYRWISLFADGSIESAVERVEPAGTERENPP